MTEEKPIQLTIADMVTLLNGIMGFTALMVLSYGDSRAFPGIDNVVLASILVLLGALFDSIDGPIAQRFGASGIGGTLDLISDAITFCVTPALILFVALHDVGPIVLLPANLIVIFGIVRLVRFYNTPEVDAHAFIGLPTPIAASIIVGVILLDVSSYGTMAVALVISYLMISNVHYPKVRAARPMLFVAGVALVGVFLALSFFSPEHRETYLASVLLIVMASLVILPFIGRND